MIDVASGIRFERDGARARIVLDRPAAGNAIDLPMAKALVAAAILCDQDETIRCVELTGEGRFFCVGGDVAAFAGAENTAAFLSELAGVLHMALARLARMAKPLVVAVNGPAAGAGVSLAALGDLVLAKRSAHFTLAYGAIGLTPDGGATWLLPRLIGLRRAQDLIMSNRRVPAEEAALIGLITAMVEDADFAAEADAACARLVQGPTAALGAAKALLAASFANGLESQMELEARAIAAAGARAESREGVRAFLEKRPPNFSSLDTQGSTARQ